MASFMERFKAGCEMGTKGAFCGSNVRKGGKTVYKDAVKWEKKTAKIESKGARRGKFW